MNNYHGMNNVAANVHFSSGGADEAARPRVTSPDKRPSINTVFHGTFRLPWYIPSIRNAEIATNPIQSKMTTHNHPVVEAELVLEAQNNLGEGVAFPALS